MRLVYIDENGNEHPVSGRPTSAENLPIAPGSSTSTAEAIGDLSQLTTTVTSSLVGAVNEVNEKATTGDYIHELLWDYVNDNSGTIPFGTYSVTLAESIDKYDCISMCFKSAYSDAGPWGQCSIFMIDVNALKTNPMHANYFNYTSFGERSSAFNLSGQTLRKIIDHDENINGLVAVYGIKYGGNK